MLRIVSILPRVGLTIAVAFSTLQAALAAAPMVDLIEFYNASQDHYFVSALNADIDALDSGQLKGWSRTGLTFRACSAPIGNASPVCRFYIPPALGDSHF